MTPYVECPEEYHGGGRSLFLAGGITGCPDWQGEIRTLLGGSGFTLINPRRAETAIDWDDPAQSRGQVEWEFRHLRKADGILFWFPAESVCPIALFELGAWTMTSKPLYIGVDPAYPRRMDVIIQTGLARPELTIYGTLQELAAAVLARERAATGVRP